MPSISFRFTTECTMTLCGNTQEEIYLRFKDFQHGDRSVLDEASIEVFPPETDQIFFSLDDGKEVFEIPNFKGDFKQDISNHSHQ